MSQTNTFKGTKVSVGDTIRVTFEGKAEELDSSDIYLKDVLDGKTRWVDTEIATKVEVTKKAARPEPTKLGTIVEGVSEYKSGDRFVRLDSGWRHINPYSGLVAGYDWDFIDQHYKTIRVLTDGSAKLPAGHKLQDLTSKAGEYARQVYGDRPFRVQEVYPGGDFNVTINSMTGTVKRSAMVALAWDILAATGAVV